MLTSNRALLALAVLLAFINIVRAGYFDWSDVGLHIAISVLCALLALRYPRSAVVAAVAVLVASVLAFTLRFVPQDWSAIKAGDDWQEVRQSLGTPVYEAASIDQARGLARGYATPSPIRFRQAGPVAIYVRGERVLWVFHNGRVVEATYVGGS